MTKNRQGLDLDHCVSEASKILEIILERPRSVFTRTAMGQEAASRILIIEKSQRIDSDYRFGSLLREVFEDLSGLSYWSMNVESAEY